MMGSNRNDSSTILPIPSASGEASSIRNFSISSSPLSEEGCRSTAMLGIEWVSDTPSESASIAKCQTRPARCRVKEDLEGHAQRPGDPSQGACLRLARVATFNLIKRGPGDFCTTGQLIGSQPLE